MICVGMLHSLERFVTRPRIYAFGAIILFIQAPFWVATDHMLAGVFAFLLGFMLFIFSYEKGTT